MIETQIDRLQDGLNRVASRVQGFPAAEMLVSRMIVLLGREINGMIDRVLGPYGLSDQDYRVLVILFCHELGAASPGELCSRILASPALMTRISDGLVAKGLITRVSSEEDRRRMVLRITAQGESLVRELLPVFFEPMRQVFADLPAADIDRIAVQLRRCAAALDRINAEAHADPRP